MENTKDIGCHACLFKDDRANDLNCKSCRESSSIILPNWKPAKESEKMTALRLAEIIEEYAAPNTVTMEAAAELRRLHQVNQELAETLNVYRKAGLCEQRKKSNI